MDSALAILSLISESSLARNLLAWKTLREIRRVAAASLVLFETEKEKQQQQGATIWRKDVE